MILRKKLAIGALPIISTHVTKKDYVSDFIFMVDEIEKRYNDYYECIIENVLGIKLSTIENLTFTENDFTKIRQFYHSQVSSKDKEEPLNFLN